MGARRTARGVRRGPGVSQVVAPARPGPPREAGLPRTGTLAEFVAEVFPPDAPRDGQGRPLGVKLGVEKFHGDGHYRLIWLAVVRGKAWLAAERVEHFRTKLAALEAGRALAAEAGVRFDERTR